VTQTHDTAHQATPITVEIFLADPFQRVLVPTELFHVSYVPRHRVTHLGEVVHHRFEELWATLPVLAYGLLHIILAAVLRNLCCYQPKLPDNLAGYRFQSLGSRGIPASQHAGSTV
jgi:hypothetical protein